MTGAPRARVLLVCLGNICRSPTAHAVLRAKATAAGVALEVDSAGTGDWHVGKPPDRRAQDHAARRGYDMSDLRARTVTPDDFLNFDLVLAMDASNLDALAPLRPGWDTSAATPQLFLEAAGAPPAPGSSPASGPREVPDPYYGGPDGFDLVLDLVEAACDALIAQIMSASGSDVTPPDEGPDDAPDDGPRNG